MFIIATKRFEIPENILFIILKLAFLLFRKRRAQFESSKTKTKRGKAKREENIDKLLDAIPMVLESAQTTAKEHSKALQKWSIMHGFDSSSDEEY